jgi:peroxin-2
MECSLGLILTVAIFGVFVYWKVEICNHRYPSMLERLFGLRLNYHKTEMSRMISHEFMNRQLVWQAFTEFFVAMLPYISLERLKWRKLQKDLPAEICAFCHQDGDKGEMEHPYVTNCGHQFCYYCLESRRLANASLSCPRCGDQITHTERVPLTIVL